MSNNIVMLWWCHAQSDFTLLLVFLASGACGWLVQLRLNCYRFDAYLASLETGIGSSPATLGVLVYCLSVGTHIKVRHELHAALWICYELARSRVRIPLLFLSAGWCAALYWLGVQPTLVMYFLRNEVHRIYAYLSGEVDGSAGSAHGAHFGGALVGTLLSMRAAPHVMGILVFLFARYYFI